MKRNLPECSAMLLAVLLASTVRAETRWQTETFAGNGAAGHAGDGGPATAAQLDNPFGITRGPDGALYVAEYTGQVIRRIAADGKISTVAGSGKKGYGGDGGPALQATLNLPHEIRFDKQGNLFIADMANHAIRRVDMKTGVISTFVGNGQPGYSGDGGAAEKAQLKQPHSIQFDSNGDLFICDVGNHVIRKVDMKSGVIATFSGTGKAGPTPDGGPIAGTPLNGPRSLDFDAQGNLWLATREGNQVLKFDLKAGKIHHIAGVGKGQPAGGTQAQQAKLSGPKGIAVAPDGNVYLADTESHSIQMINVQKGTLELIAGTGLKGDGPDGDALKCKMARPHGVYMDTDGSLFVGDSEAHRVRALKLK
jgi:streptogramin lyase